MRALFIDPGVDDAATLLAGAAPGVDARMLDAGQDGLAQIAQALAGSTGLASVSVVAHGASGSLCLGSVTLDAAALAGRAAELAAIGRALAPSGVLALYACEAGAGERGRALVEQLGRLAGVTVAASSRPVGGANAGAWALDVLSEGAVRSDAVACAPPIGSAVLAAYAPTLSGSGAPQPPPAFPIDITNFGTASAAGSFVVHGSATVSGAALLLTADALSQAGIAVYTTPFSSGGGVTFNFTYESDGGNGADGVSFFLLNGDSLTGGASSVIAGGYGGGLGYSDDARAGITDGFLGIGFDTYGNYSASDHSPQTGPGKAPNSVALRGEGTGTTGYNYLAGTLSSLGIDGKRDVQVNILKINAGEEQVDVYMRPSGSAGTYTHVLTEDVNQVLPSQFYFGFAASTGGSDDLHAIDSVAVTLPVTLNFGTPTVHDATSGATNPATLSPGDSFSYTYTLSNAGPNGDADITLSDLLPANVLGGTWTVQDSAGSHTGTGSAIPVNLLSGATATIVVGGTIDPNATSGNADHAVTVTPGAAYTLTNPNASAGISLQIGHGGSSVSLADANGSSTAAEGATTRPFAAASVIDTFVDPATGAGPVDTMTVAVSPSSGTLAASGASYDAATGTLTASGTAAQLSTILRSLTLTNTAHAAAPGSTTPVALVVHVTDTDTANTTGGGAGTASATQTATVGVLEAHDTPTVSGGGGGQPVLDTATATPFAGVAVLDPDDTSLVATVTILGAAAAAGSFTAASAAGWTEATSGGRQVYTRSFAAQTNVGAAVQAAVDALVFQPVAHVMAPGSSATTGFSVAVTDGLGTASATDTLPSVTVTAASDAPVLGGASASQLAHSISDVQSVAPFGTVTVTDPDDTSATATVTVSGSVVGGALTAASTAGWAVSSANGTTTYTRSFAAQTNVGAVVQGAVDALVFQPAAHVAPPGTVRTDIIGLRIATALPSAVLSASSGVTVTATHDLPVISGAVPAQAMTDLEQHAPFSTLAVAAPDDTGATATVTISGGTLTGDFTPGSAAGWTRSVNGADIVYTRLFTPTPGIGAPVQAAIDALVFRPLAHVAAPGSVTTTGFVVRVADTAGGVASDSHSSVAVTASTDSPVLGGLDTLSKTTSDTTPVQPFGGLTVTDPDFTGGRVSVSIAGADPAAAAGGGGDFTAASAQGWTRTVSGGTITYAETIAAGPDVGAREQAAVAALVFQPLLHATAPGVSQTTVFDLTLGTSQPPVSVTATATVASVGSLLPFLPLVAGGSDPNQVVTVTAALPAGTIGTYSDLGTGAVGPDGLTYVVTGTDAEITAALHTVAFTPASPAVTTLSENFTALVVGSGSATTLSDTGTGNSVLVAGSGNDTVSTGVGDDTVFGGTGSGLLLGGGGNDLFVAAAGASTIFAGSGSATVYGSDGQMTFVNSGAASSVFGGAGFAGVFGGTGTLQAYGGGGGVYYGGTGGGNLLVAGTGQSFLLGGGGGDRLYTNSAAQDVLAAGSGNETLVGTGSGGDNIFFGGNGNDLIAAGNGNTLVVAGSGHDSVFTGATGSTVTYGTTGNTLLVEGSGTDLFSAGSGTATVDGGTGTDIVSIVDGHAGGSVTLNDFKPGTDQVGLYGYAAGEAARALATATVGGGATTLTLSDHTRISFTGLTLAQLAGAVVGAS